jgi:putative cell wall-binding protein
LRDRLRAPLVAALVAALVVLSTLPAATNAAGYKVAVIVGPTGAQTSDYRSYADDVAAAATARGATVVKVYSPNATWANVKAAVNGANIIVWMGHGNGWPNPYTSPPNSLSSTEPTDRDNGWGLNRTTTNADGDNWSSTMVYCGEKALLGTLTSASTAQWSYCGGSTNTDGITPAPGFVMIYAHACYTPGAGEARPASSETIAKARVANYSYPVLKLGAGAYFATDYGDEADLVSRLLANPALSFGDAFRAGRGFDPGAIRSTPHPDLAGRQVWIQQTTNQWLGTDYWYAFAGDPHRTLSGALVSPTPTAVERYAGTNRYGTAAAVAAANFAPGVQVAYVSTGGNFPDALAAGAAAAHDGGPVLLVGPSSVPPETAAELERLQPGRIVVVGGSSVVPDAVVNELAAYATSGEVTRIAGASRYESAALVSAATFAPGVAAAYIATGSSFPDALAGVPASGVAEGPVRLVGPDGLSDAVRTELARLAPGRIVILGSTSVVSTATATELAGYAPVTRLAGASRYETAAAVSAGMFASASTVYLATGANFPDALGGGPVAAMVSGPLLLMANGFAPLAAARELQRLNPSHVVVLGGTNVIADAAIAQLRVILGD